MLQLPWKIITVAVAFVGAVLLVGCVLLVLYRYLSSHRGSNPHRGLHAGVNILQRLQSSRDSIQKLNINRGVYGDQYSYAEEAFSWNDHPSLIAETMEHGWASFAFTYNNHNINNSSPSPNLWELCTGSGRTHDQEMAEPEITWEIVSAHNFMQKIRLNPGLKPEKLFPSVQAVQTGLPLPGPLLGTLGFPQEAYFEITIVSEGPDSLGNYFNFVENIDDRVKLIQKSLLSDARLNSRNSPIITKISEVERGDDIIRCEIAIKEAINSYGDHRIFAVGQSTCGSSAFTLPGLQTGSVGFHSNGFVFLNGEPHAEQKSGCTAERGWGCVGNVIGCGFEPATRKVFFTLNGEQIYSVVCKSDDFGSPLYPTVAANYDVTVMVNFGQQSFEYKCANSERVCDPSVRVKSRGHLDDSGELFSMGRIDPHWLHSQAKNVEVGGGFCSEVEESDLFEIVLDANKSCLGCK